MSSAARPQTRMRVQPHGFTLIELLVVLLIIGLCIGVVSAIARPGDRAVLELEAERLAQLLDLAADEARLTGKTISWTSDGAGYRFRRYTEDFGWSDVRDSGPLRARSLPAGARVSRLRVENMQPQGLMRLDFTPYATALSFDIDLSLGPEHYVVAGSATGAVQVQRNARPAHAAPR